MDRHPNPNPKSNPNSSPNSNPNPITKQKETINKIKKLDADFGEQGIPRTLAQTIKRSYNSRVTENNTKNNAKNNTKNKDGETDTPASSDWRDQLLQIEQRKITETEAFLNIILYKLADGDETVYNDQRSSHEENVETELQKMLDVLGRSRDTPYGV